MLTRYANRYTGVEYVKANDGLPLPKNCDDKNMSARDRQICQELDLLTLNRGHNSLTDGPINKVQSRKGH